MPVQIRAGKHKRRNLLAILPELNVCQIPAHAHKERAPEDVGGFKTG